MKYVDYDHSQIMTSDAIADAVIRYAAALADHQHADVVAVPTSDPYGMACTVEILLGPAIGVAVSPAPDDELEPEGDFFVLELRARTEALLAA